MISDETKKKIQQVASVCIRCRRCMKECLMLNRFAQNPKALFTQYLEVGPENMDRHIAYSCNECSQCTLKCPKGLNLKAVFQSLKADYAAGNHGIVPLEALLPSERGQDLECAPQFCTALTGGTVPHSRARAKYLFIPGQFPPGPVMAHLEESLGRGNVDMLHEPVLEQVSSRVREAVEACPDQVLITACPSGYRSLRQALPDRRILFYWDLMHDFIGLPQEDIQDRPHIRLHGDSATDESIRWVLQKLGCQWTEVPEPAGPLSADQDCRQILGLLFGESRKSGASGTET